MRSWWDEPAVADPPARVWRDWILLGAVVLAAVVEVLVRPDVTWRPVAFVECIVLATTLLWRRTHPLAVVLIVFGVSLILDLAARGSGSGTPPFGLYAMAFALVLPYALCRWASGRDVVIGLVFIAVTHVIRQVATDRMSDLIAGIAFLLTSAALGLAVRYAVASRRRQVEQYRLLEREQLARELHDTVAHHVSAIAIQAQAAQVVSGTNPSAAREALQAIESEATRALAEMRLMVGTLRDGAAPALAPQRGVADLGQLAISGRTPPRIDVRVSGDVTGLAPGIDAAIFRIAQESVTNALRHAREATRIEVSVVGADDVVRLEIIDDGSDSGAVTPDAGFGLVGMAERVALLDGTFEAGPGPHGGWAVSAVLPRRISAA
jgi:signal transduction histidine kinase